jgi:hypothetical protein
VVIGNNVLALASPHQIKIPGVLTESGKSRPAGFYVGKPAIFLLNQTGTKTENLL